ncbi:MAG: class I SAM-dependent methyltransferase [Saprospiraceae bacterium]|nr:class I SAM-dependent methyltransferase [Saprospiraceae bacterium]
MPIRYHSNPAAYAKKEHLYLEVRRREGRVPSDEELLQLPEVTQPPALAREWRWRKRAFQRLDNYLNRRFREFPIRVLDLGCGNGWMSNLLAANPLRSVTAVDLNETELEQGSRVFRRDNLQFVYGDILQDGWPEQSFEVIVLAASVQYFPDLGELIATLKKLLTPNGEIHLLDSNFYRDAAATDAARKRTEAYYEQVGVPEMAGYYHHHLRWEVLACGGEDLNAGLWMALLRRVKYLGPFPWLRIVL